jgi:hypothetical protein
MRVVGVTGTDIRVLDEDKRRKRHIDEIRSYRVWCRNKSRTGWGCASGERGEGFRGV